MGVHGLLTYCRPIQTHANMNLRGLNIGVDAFSLFFLFKDEKEKFKKYLEGMIALDHSLTFILDRRANKEKKDTLIARKEQRKEAKDEMERLEEYVKTPEFAELNEDEQGFVIAKIQKKKKESWHVTKEYTKWFTELLESLGDKCKMEWAKEEADSVLIGRKWDVIISSDSDIIVCGAPRLWMARGIGLQHNEILGEKFRSFIGLSSPEQMKELAFLVGCDVHPERVVTIPVALSWLRFYGNLDKIHERMPAKLNSTLLTEYKRLVESGAL